MRDPMADVRYRELTSDELAMLGPLWEASGLSHRPAGRDTMENLLSQRQGFASGFLGAFDGGTLIGAVIATHDGRRGWINRLAVHPHYRGKGIAKKLISAAESALRKQGLRIIAALIEDDNVASRTLFARAGYESLPEILYYSKRESSDA